MDIAAAIGLTETQTPQHIILVRLLIAAGLGALIGFEREVHADAAGLRTHILIAVAACLFTVLTFEIFHMSDVQGAGNADPIRAVEAVTAGIAFLGAGAIFQLRGSVKGLTTGAGMWLAGAVGVATALGYYLIAGAVTAMALVVLLALRVFVAKALRTKPDKGEPLDREPRP
jgi:putative Mg2+ transporter-C (MgtC) family protein